MQLVTQPRLVRRQDKIVTNKAWIQEILCRGQYLSLAMVEANGSPYVTASSYAYDTQNHCIYLHGAQQGKKVEILTDKPQVCFQIVLDAEIVGHESVASKFTWKYRSVTGFGRVVTLQSLADKNHAIKTIIEHFGAPATTLDEKDNYVWVARLEIEHLTGKSSVYPQP